MPLLRKRQVVEELDEASTAALTPPPAPVSVSPRRRGSARGGRGLGNKGGRAKTAADDEGGSVTGSRGAAKDRGRGTGGKGKRGRAP